MKAYWSDTRANGNPIETGTFCRVIDLEDGTHPIFVYGKTKEEVFEKIERQNVNAQLTINQQRTAAAARPPAPPRVISADDVMQATVDLTNPAKSGKAVATLLEAATGVDPVQQARRNYAALAMEWEAETPDFYPHAGNRQLVGDRAIRAAGGKPGLVTKEVLTQAFLQLQAEGLLFERVVEPGSHDPNDPTHSTFPVETPVQRIERPRGTRFATGARSTTFSAPQTSQTRTLKYTEEQIRTMPEKERMRVFNDPDYIAACDFFYSGGARATA